MTTAAGRSGKDRPMNDAHKSQPAAPVLPDTTGWVKCEPGDVIEAGTPFVCRHTTDTATAQINGVSYDFELTHSDDYWTPPPPARTPVDDIPVGRENAKLLVVNGVVGTYFRETHDADPYLWSITPESRASVIRKDRITSVEPLHVIPAELAEEIKAWANLEGSRRARSMLSDVEKALR